jgi:hypothetical protein
MIGSDFGIRSGGGRLMLADFPNVTQGMAFSKGLYAGCPLFSIYSIHIYHLVEQCGYSVFQVPHAKLRSRDRAASVALARQTAMYLAHVTFGLSFSEVGQLFGRDRTTVAYACRVVEDLRDDPVTDKALTILEAMLSRQRLS